jgi:hypothetical protein
VAVTDPVGEPSSLLDWATGLARDEDLQVRLAAEPGAVLGEHGFARIAPNDLHRALPLVAEAVAGRLGHEVDVSTLGGAAVRLPGEDAAQALARHFGAVAHVVAVPPAEDPTPDVDPAPDAPTTPPESAVPRTESVDPDLPADPADPVDPADDVEPEVQVDAVVDRELDADRAAGGGAGAATRVQTEARGPVDVRSAALRPDPPVVAAVTTVELADGEPLDGLDPTDPGGELTDVLHPTVSPAGADALPDDDVPAPSFGAGADRNLDVAPAFGTGSADLPEPVDALGEPDGGPVAPDPDLLGPGHGDVLLADEAPAPDLPVEPDVDPSSDTDEAPAAEAAPDPI